MPYSVYKYERRWLCRMNLNARPKLKLCFDSQWVRCDAIAQGGRLKITFGKMGWRILDSGYNWSSNFEETVKGKFLCSSLFIVRRFLMVVVLGFAAKGLNGKSQLTSTLCLISYTLNQFVLRNIWQGESDVWNKEMQNVQKRHCR